MALKHWLAGALVAAAVGASSADAQRPTVTSPRIYVFENGTISGLDPALFNFKREELKEVDFVDMAYLIVHPRGTVMVDTGSLPDSHFKADGAPVVEGVVTATKPVLPQLKAAGYEPRDITYLVLSHYHSDHTGNANAFAGSTWVVQKAERDYMFADKPEGIIQPDTYSALRKLPRCSRAHRAEPGNDYIVVVRSHALRRLRIGVAQCRDHARHLGFDERCRARRRAAMVVAGL